MKKCALILMAFLMVFGFVIAASAATVEIDLGMDGIWDTGTTYDLMVGETTSAGIYISGVNDTNPMIGFMSYLDFNDSQLSATNSLLGSDWDDGLTIITPGKVYGEGFSFSGLDGDILLFSFDITCIAPGQSALVFTDPNPNFPDDLALEIGDLDNLFGQELAKINNVPIPGAFWLFASGLIGLFVRRKKP